jgi:hypothetical protein
MQRNAIFSFFKLLTLSFFKAGSKSSHMFFKQFKIWNFESVYGKYTQNSKISFLDKKSSLIK